MKRTPGVTLVELLVAMSIFLVLLTLLFSFLNLNQRAASRQQAQTTALTDARSTITHLTEVLTQAAYIYPAGQTLQVKIAGVKRTITTGDTAVALLIVDPVCSSSTTCTHQYLGRVFFLDDRTAYPDELPANPQLPTVLVEGRTDAPFAWPTNTLPTLDWTAAGNTLSTGVQGEGLVAGRSTLMGADSGFAEYAATDDTVFSTGLARPGQTPTLDQPNALINHLAFQLTVQPSRNEGQPISVDGSANARNVPRAN